jgi:hypothetical protein
MNKERYIYTMKYYSIIEKNEMMSFAGKWMELEIMLSKIGQTQKDTYHKFSLIYVIYTF